MAIESIGTVVRPEDIRSDDERVYFSVPSDGEPQTIALSQEELWALHHEGIRRLLARQAMNLRDLLRVSHQVDLLPELPLFVWAEGIDNS